MGEFNNDMHLNGFRNITLTKERTIFKTSRMKTRGAVESVEAAVEGLEQAEERLQRTVASLHEGLAAGEFSKSTWHRASTRVEALLEAYPGRQDPAIAAVLNRIDKLGDVLAAIGDQAPPEETPCSRDDSEEPKPKGERDAAAQFKTTLPCFSGKPDDLEGWKSILVARLTTARIQDPEVMFGVIADGHLLPEALRSKVLCAKSWNEFWARLDKAVPFRRVRLAIWEHLALLQQLGETNTQAAVADFQQGVETFITKCEERSWDGDMTSRAVVEFVLEKMGATLRERFFCWEDMKFDLRTTDIKRINDFMDSYQSAMGRDHTEEEPRKGARTAAARIPALAAGRNGINGQRKTRRPRTMTPRSPSRPRHQAGSPTEKSQRAARQRLHRRSRCTPQGLRR